MLEPQCNAFHCGRYLAPLPRGYQNWDISFRKQAGKISFTWHEKSSWTHLVLFYEEQTFICWELQKDFLCKIEVPQEPSDQKTFLSMLFDLNWFLFTQKGSSRFACWNNDNMSFFVCIWNTLAIFAALTSFFSFIFNDQRPEGETIWTHASNHVDCYPQHQQKNLL